MITVYYVYKKQFIGELEVDKNSISIWCDQYTDRDEYKKRTNPPSFNGCYKFNDFYIIPKDCEDIPDDYCGSLKRAPKPIYYDVNLNRVEIDTINSIKLESKDIFEEDAEGYTYLYKSLDVIQQRVLDFIYNSYWNNKKYVTPSELYVEPEKNTGIINLYDDYGDLSYKYFHVNGKINGEYIKYWQSGVNLIGEECEACCETTFYINGVMQGKSTIITVSNKLLEESFYENDVLEGDKISYDLNGNKKNVIKYVNGIMIEQILYYENGNVRIHNKFNGSYLISHRSYYENNKMHLGVRFCKNNVYRLQHYFKNEKIAWRCIHDVTTRKNNVIEINDEEGNKILEDEFNEKYKTNLKPRDIRRLFPYCYQFVCPESASFSKIFEYANNNLCAI